MKTKLLPLLLTALPLSQSHAALIISGVIDGDLTGGNPKAVVFTATNAIPDLSIYGFGSANNGGGSDGEEFTFSGSATSGQVFVVASNSVSESFFLTNYVGITVLTSGAAGINGDDAIELFESSSVIDTYGDINTNGDGESWDYTDGFAVRTGGAAGAFNQANYNSVFQGLDGQSESQQVTTLENAFGFTVVPEPSTALLGGLGLLALLRRRSR